MATKKGTTKTTAKTRAPKGAVVKSIKPAEKVANVIDTAEGKNPTPDAVLAAAHINPDTGADNSADADGATPIDEGLATLEHRKVFVLGGRNAEAIADAIDGGSYDHEPNFVATRTYMISQGLRPDGKVTFDGWEYNADGVSLDLAYVVNAVPAEDVPTVEGVSFPPEVAHAEAVQTAE